jgi:hypothetical protein
LFINFDHTDLLILGWFSFKSDWAKSIVSIESAASPDIAINQMARRACGESQQSDNFAMKGTPLVTPVTAWAGLNFIQTEPVDVEVQKLLGKNQLGCLVRSEAGSHLGAASVGLQKVPQAKNQVKELDRTTSRGLIPSQLEQLGALQPLGSKVLYQSQQLGREEGGEQAHCLECLSCGRWRWWHSDSVQQGIRHNLHPWLM